jgi:hypothetical protein
LPKISRSAAEQHDHLVVEFVLGQEEAVLGRPLNRIAEGPDTARDDRDLLYFVGPRQQRRDQRMAHLVIGDDLALLRAEQPALLFKACDDPLDRGGKIGRHDILRASAGRQQRGLVDECREVGAGEAGSERRDFLGGDIGPKANLSEIDAEDLYAAGLVGPVDQDLPVEAPSAQKRGVEDFGPVGRRQQNHANGRIEAVDLGQKLVERLFLFVIAANT